MNKPVEPASCPRCGAPLTPGALQGFCPRCLLALNIGTETDITTAGPAPKDAKSERAPEPPGLEEIGRLFPGLEVLALLGHGGMGAVYKARQKQLDRIVALKMLPPRRQDDAAFAERFTREARALARLNHSNIVAVYEFGQVSQGNVGVSPASEPAVPYFIMEFVDGREPAAARAGRAGSRRARRSRSCPRFARRCNSRTTRA